MYDNDLKIKENENWTKDKIEPQQIYRANPENNLLVSYGI